MQLPGADGAIIEPRKVRDYLLSPTHPVGRHKAVFFGALGYSQGDWAVLASDLRSLAQHGESAESERTEYGQKYETRGTLTGPNGRRARVVVAWITLVDEDVPRLVTAFPEA